jgi:hypothetical protein
MDKGRAIGAFIAAVLVTLVAASAVHTNVVIAGLTALGVEVPVGLRLQTMWGDLLGLAPAFGAVIALALLFGFLIAAVARRWIKLPRSIAFALAGGAALGTALALMALAYNGITPLASVRGWGGFLLMCAAGALGGLVFAAISRPCTVRPV